MTPKLSSELSQAALQHPDEPLRVEDATGNRVYYVLAEPLADRAMQALQETQGWNDLQESISQADAGQTVSLKQADQAIRSQLSFPKPA